MKVTKTDGGIDITVAGVADCPWCPETPLGYRCRQCGSAPWLSAVAKVDEDSDEDSVRLDECWELQETDEQFRGVSSDVQLEEERDELNAMLESLSPAEMAAVVQTARMLIEDVHDQRARRRAKLLEVAEEQLAQLQAWVESQDDPHAAMSDGAWLDGEKLIVFRAPDCVSDVIGYDADAEAWGLWRIIPGEPAGISALVGKGVELIEW